MSALSPRRRSVLRAAITTATLAGAVLAPAAAAFAADSAPVVAPAPAAAVNPAAPAAKPAAEPGVPAKPAGDAAPKTTSAGEDAKKTAADKQTGTPAKAGAEKAAKKDSKDSGEKADAEELVGTHDLRGSAVIRVYKIGPNHYQGRIARTHASGAAVAIVEADGKTGSVMFNDQLIKVSATDGSVEILNDKGSGGQGPVTPVRYTGNAVYIGNGLVAVLRNDPDAGGPEAWIRAVGEQWKPGDTYMLKVLGKLDRDETSTEVKGLRLRLLDANGSAPVLEVRGDGGTKTFALPKGLPAAGKNTAESAEDCVVTKEVNIGAGTIAVMTNGPEGPSVRYKDGPGDISDVIADRAHPQGDGNIKILDAGSAHPKLWFKMQGGGYPAGTEAFPVPSADCVTDGQSTGATGGSATRAKAVNASAQFTQTKAIPQGGVAAGAEGVREGNDTMLLAAGGALASVSAAGIAFAVLRRRAVGSAA
ncbi:hypothetical protein [Streptomyces sp. UNOB3_S3]|uniref:hypothetical protein n=1 Tax=Streptomyces sp. UNOB3_S3 TaxID=2871682 RepID=UPI001E5058FD|nr:hypothetical protein [Streptomyces sp. UNOB3_S3]MCC3778900.1 hypothetical protein [Streptomyces sp. UNOB3_S3]